MAVDYFLKIDGIEGESQDKTHEKQIQISSWSWGETQSGSMAMGGGGGSGKVSMQDFHFTKHLDKASPKLFLACAGGEHIKKATLYMRKAGKTAQEYSTIDFTDCLISSFQLGGHGETPDEQVSLNFTKIEVSYKPQKADGSLDGAVKTGWDLKKNSQA